MTKGSTGATRTGSRRWSFSLEEEFGTRNITRDVQEFVTELGVEEGIVNVQLTGSTGALTTIEYESGALQDLRRALDLIAPTDQTYAHNERWGDGNGFSHVRSALLKTSLAVPVIDGVLQLGTWQQILLVNLDNRAREREVVAVVLGT